MSRKRFTEEEKRAHVSHWSASGESKASYSRSHGLSYGVFHRWTIEYGPVGPGFVPMELEAGAPSSPKFELSLPCGTRIRVY